MRLSFACGVIVAFAMTSIHSVLAANEEPEAAGEDSSAGLPEQYAKDYLTAGSTVSPDKKFAMTDPKGISEHRWSAHLKAVWMFRRETLRRRKLRKGHQSRVTISPVQVRPS
jgi:hypothetical protein